MNISYNWLKDLIDIELSPAEVGEMLTRVGLAVEGIHPHGDDFVFDIDLTSNRPDCLSHLGVARELGVITASSLTERTETTAQVPLPAVLAGEIVTIEDADLCHRFTARIIKNVEIGPSPKWLIDRLEAIGERSINNVADITNYVMHELGQPMHSFDLDKLAGGRIIVRRAKADEEITTLDEVERKLDDTMLAICDEVRPAAIAGIMGGLESSITDETVNVLLEVAYFKRENIRSTSRKLNLSTEASYRFERGVDLENLVRASTRATQMICEIAGGEAGDLIDLYPTPEIANTVESIDISRAVKRLTGLEVESNKCLRILTSLGIDPRYEDEDPDKQVKYFAAPSWRHDIAIEVDLVEEIARHSGYENIGTELPPAYGAGEYQATEPRHKLFRQSLVDLGFDEAISYSFIDTKHDETIEVVPSFVGRELVTLADSVIEGAVRMRPTLLPGLLAAIRANFNQQRKGLRLFEIGKAFAAGESEGALPYERDLIALVMTGGDMLQGRAIAERDVDFYDAKGAVQAALEAAGVEPAAFSVADVRHLRKGQTADISIAGKLIGYMGRLSDDISAGYKFKQPIYVAEFDLQDALDVAQLLPIYHPLPKFPGITRDVSFVVKREFLYASIGETLAVHLNESFRGVSFVDIYEGKGLEPDERSLTIRLEYRRDDRTLTESEVDALHKDILEHLARSLSIQPRV
ncbi:MAG: phenylalanine--tRNA ligase subunit beta [Acidobacteriota bacterium]